MSTFVGESTDRLGLLLHALATHPVLRDDATAYAMRKATAFVACRDLDRALRMLEYAHRLAPSDGTISLAMAVVRLILGDPLAAESLEKLTLHTTWRDLWMALILVHMRSGNHERAASDLQTVLSRIASPCNPADIGLATTVRYGRDPA